MNEVIDFLNSKILEYSGINIADSQKAPLLAHVEKKAASKNISALSYCQQLEPRSSDFDEIINFVTVNETYFFREELQFDFLKNEVFPKYMGRNLTIWSWRVGQTAEQTVVGIHHGFQLTVVGELPDADVNHRMVFPDLRAAVEAPDFSPGVFKVNM